MELRQLAYFATVAEERHFGRAAAKLYMSTSGLSQQIRVLERRVGAVLFVRASTGVHLTPAGEYLLGEARQLLRAADLTAARTRAIHEAGPAGKLALLVDADVALITDDAIVSFAADHPGVDVALETVGQHLLHDRITGPGTWHLALSWSHPAHLSHRRVLNVSWHAVVAAGHPLAHRPGAAGVTRRQLADYPLLLVDRREAADLYDVVMAGLGRSAMQPRVAAGPVAGATVPMTLRRLRSSPTNAFTVAPPEALQYGMSQGLVGLPLTPALTAPVEAMWPGQDPHPLAAAFLAHLDRYAELRSGGDGADPGLASDPGRVA